MTPELLYKSLCSFDNFDYVLAFLLMGVVILVSLCVAKKKKLQGYYKRRNNKILDDDESKFYYINDNEKSYNIFRKQNVYQKLCA